MPPSVTLALLVLLAQILCVLSQTSSTSSTSTTSSTSLGCSSDRHCTLNSRCLIKEGVCACKPWFYGDGYACTPVLNRRCSNATDCSPNGERNIVCQNKIDMPRTCGCTPQYQVFQNTCIPGVGADCASNSTCTPLSNSYCFNGKCSCLPWYFQNVGRFGTNCSSVFQKPCEGDGMCRQNGETNIVCSKTNVCDCVTGSERVSNKCKPIMCKNPTATGQSLKYGDSYIDGCMNCTCKQSGNTSCVSVCPPLDSDYPPQCSDGNSPIATRILGDKCNCKLWFCTGQQAIPECLPGWDIVVRSPSLPSKRAIQESSSRKSIVCFKILQPSEKYTWESGRGQCGKELGFLSNLARDYYDSDDRFFNSWLDRLSSQNTFWTGGHLDSISDKFFWDGIPLLPIKLPSAPGLTPYAWQKNQPNLQIGTCVAATVYIGSYQRVKVNVTTTPCTDELPVVCQNKGFVPSLKKVSKCGGNGWLGAVELDKCYRYQYMKPLRYSEAQRDCRAHGGNLALLSSYFLEMYIRSIVPDAVPGTRDPAAGYKTFIGLSFAEGVYTWANGSSAPIEYVGEMLPVDKTSLSSYCYVMVNENLAGNRRRSRFQATNCSQAYPYVCEKASQKLGVVNFSEVPANTTIYVNTRSEDQESRDQIINVTCIPSGEHAGITWRINGNPVRLHSNSNGLVLQSKDLYNFESGLYQCEAWRYKPFKKVASKPALIKLWGVRHFIGRFKLPQGTFNRSHALYNRFESNSNNDQTLRGLESEILRSLKRSLPQKITQVTLRPVLYSAGSLVINFRLSVTLNPLAEISNLNLLKKIQTVMTTSASQFKIDPKSIQLMSTAFCPATNIDSGGQVYKFQRTKVNNMGESQGICGTTGKPLAELMCDGSFLIGASWSRNIRVIECLEKESTVTPALRDLSQVEINDSNVETVAAETVLLTADPNKLNTADIVYTSVIVDQITDLENVTIQTGEEVAKVLNNILSVNSSVIGDAERAYNASSRLTKSIESVTNLVQFDEGTDEIKTVLPNIAVTVWKVDNSTVNTILGIQVTSSTGNQGLQEDSIQPVYNLSSSQGATNIDIGIVLPPSTVKPSGFLFLFNETKNSKNLFGDKIYEDTSAVQTAEDCAALCVKLYKEERTYRKCIAFDFEAILKICILRRSVGSVESLQQIIDWSSYVYMPEWKNEQRLSFVVYNNWKLFQSRYELYGNISGVNEWLTYSKVITAKINSRSLDTSLDDPLVSTFLPAREDNLTGEKVCAFWDYGLNDWSSEGCWYNGSQDGRHICMCDHLTNFALLLDVHGQSSPIPDDHKLALTIISIIGLSLSIIGLVCTVVTFLVFRFYTPTSPASKTAGFKNLRKGRSQQSLFNLALALLFSMIVFLAGVEQTSNRAGCIAVAVLLHYFLLVSFAWMLVEGVIQYLRFVKVLGTYIPRFMLKACLLAWGLPAVVCVISLAVDYNLYRGGEQYCWLSRDLFYYAFMLPVCAIILINIVFFALVVHALTCARSSLQTNQSERKTAILHLNAAICTLLLLGITWVFGFFAINDARLAFQYIFCICNSLQGFFIFIFFNVREKQVRAAWQSICCKVKPDGQYTVTRQSESSSQGATKSRSETDTKKVPMEPLEMKNQLFDDKDLTL